MTHQRGGPALAAVVSNAQLKPTTARATRHGTACACACCHNFKRPERTRRVCDSARHCMLSTPAGSPWTRYPLGRRLGDLVGPMSQQVGVKVRVEAFAGDPLGPSRGTACLRVNSSGQENSQVLDENRSSRGDHEGLRRSSLVRHSTHLQTLYRLAQRDPHAQRTSHVRRS